MPQSPLAVTTLMQIHLGPTLRANPFPEVTNLFCQLHLSTFFYQVKAANLEDLQPLLNLGSPGTIHTCKQAQPDHAAYTPLGSILFSMLSDHCKASLLM